MTVSYLVFPGLEQTALTQKQRLSIYRGQKTINPKKILTAVLNFYGASELDVRSGSRKRDLVWCRQVFFHLSLKYTGMTMEQMGDFLGGRDHTTVIHARDTVKDILETEPEKRDELREIEYMIFFEPTVAKQKETIPSK